MSEERKLQRAKINLLRSPKFALLSGILMVGKTSVVDDLPMPACTDGRDEKYKRSFIASMSDPEVAFVVAHEAAHKMYRHLTTWQRLYDENPRLANMACDYVINLMLLDTDPTGSVITMPLYKTGPNRGKPMGLIDKRFAGMNTKQVFDILKKEEEEGEGGGGDGDGGFDEHDWEGAKGRSEEEQKELHKTIDDAIRRGVAEQKRVGEGNGHLDREFADLLEPKVDWREVLRDFVKSTCAGRDKSSWRKVNRRFLSLGDDTYMPSLISEQVGHIVIGVDTSGSIGGSELRDFLTEVKGIAEEVKPKQVDLLYWDSHVASHEEYDAASVPNIVSSTKPRGGGGTAPSCVTAYMHEKVIQPECVVMLTDGYVGSDWGESNGHSWPAPVLWVVVGGADVTAPNGKTIAIK